MECHSLTKIALQKLHPLHWKCRGVVGVIFAEEGITGWFKRKLQVSTGKEGVPSAQIVIFKHKSI